MESPLPCLKCTFPLTAVLVFTSEALRASRCHFFVSRKTERWAATAGDFLGKQQLSEAEDLKPLGSIAGVVSAYKLHCHKKVLISFLVASWNLPPYIFHLFCRVSSLSMSLRMHIENTRSCSRRGRLLSALPCLTHFECFWSRRRAFPAWKGKTPPCSISCYGKSRSSNGQLRHRRYLPVL